MYTLVSTALAGARQLVVAVLSVVLPGVEDPLSPQPAPFGGVRTVSFGLDGTTYEIDLSPADAAAFREDLATWVRRARPIGGSTTTRGASRAPRPPRVTTVPGVPATTIRQWARANGVTVSDRGRLPAAVRQAYAAAH